jgi:hypothetical protein
MIQIILEVLIIGLLTTLAGIILMIVNDVVDQNHAPKDNQ